MAFTVGQRVRVLSVDTVTEAHGVVRVGQVVTIEQVRSEGFGGTLLTVRNDSGDTAAMLSFRFEAVEANVFETGKTYRVLTDQPNFAPVKPGDIIRLREKDTSYSDAFFFEILSAGDGRSNLSDDGCFIRANSTNLAPVDEPAAVGATVPAALFVEKSREAAEKYGWCEVWSDTLREEFGIDPDGGMPLGEFEAGDEVIWHDEVNDSLATPRRVVYMDGNTDDLYRLMNNRLAKIVSKRDFRKPGKSEPTGEVEVSKIVSVAQQKGDQHGHRSEVDAELKAWGLLPAGPQPGEFAAGDKIKFTDGGGTVYTVVRLFASDELYRVGPNHTMRKITEPMRFVKIED